MRTRIEMQLTGIALVFLIATGCGQNHQTIADEEPETVQVEAALPRADTVKAARHSHTLSVDLPGASVHGLEKTLLEAKVGGYVKEISDFQDATGKTEDVDIGTYVNKDDVLAVLDAPEMLDELRQKEALVLQAESDVAQYAAAIRQAEAEKVSAEAALDEAKTQRLEKEALHKFAQAEFDHQEQLYNTQATTRELLIKARAQLDVALASLASADARIRTAEAAVLAAEAHVHKAEADHQSSLANVQVANAALSHTKTLVEFANIRAPFTGVVTKRMVDHGTFVRPATSNSAAMPLFEVTRSDKLRLIAKVPMIRAERIKLGQPVIFHSIGGLPGVTIAGQVSRSAAVLDPESRMLEIHVYLTNPVKQSAWIKQDGKWVKEKTGSRRSVALKPGMVGNATILESWEDLAIVPTTAVGFSEAGNSYVLVVEDVDGKKYCRRRNVDVAFNDASEVGISAGIIPGDTVIAKNIDRLTDGQQVAAVDGI